MTGCMRLLISSRGPSDLAWGESDVSCLDEAYTEICMLALPVGKGTVLRHRRLWEGEWLAGFWHGWLSMCDTLIDDRGNRVDLWLEECKFTF